MAGARRAREYAATPAVGAPLTGYSAAILYGYRAWPGDMAADYDASAERFELSPSGRWGAPGALPPGYAAGRSTLPDIRTGY
jgi:hypothetical protein